MIISPLPSQGLEIAVGKDGFVRIHNTGNSGADGEIVFSPDEIPMLLDWLKDILEQIRK